jgi:hypothetical protein
MKAFGLAGVTQNALCPRSKEEETERPYGRTSQKINRQDRPKERGWRIRRRIGEVGA